MHRLASIIASIGILACIITGCAENQDARKALVEANLLSSGFYQIQIAGNNPIVSFAYKTEALHIGQETQWEGVATVGAFDMAFQQNCHSVYSPEIKAKRWRGKWVRSTATTPTAQILLWLQEMSAGRGEISSEPASKPDFLSARAGEVLAVTLSDAPMLWNAICDAHIDTLFGSQAFLTDLKEAEAILYFDADTHTFLGAAFQGSYGQTAITGTIVLSATDGHTIGSFPPPEKISEGTLSEEWQVLQE